MVGLYSKMRRWWAHINRQRCSDPTHASVNGGWKM